MPTGRRTDGQTDMTKLIIVFRNFLIAPDKLILSYNGMKSVYCAVRTGYFFRLI